MSAPPAGAAPGRWLAIAASVVVVATVVASVLVTGTPAQRRAIKLDERRVEDLQRLSSAIDRHYRANNQLPASLAVVAGKPGSRLDIVDPVTAAPYGYEPAGKKSYRLCAVFTTDTSVTGSPVGTRWEHGVGRQCFGDDVD